MGTYILISVLILIACILLVLVVLVQNPKGGGLSSTFGGSNQVMGVKKTADFLEKATWTLGIILLVLSLLSIFVIPRNTNVQQAGSELQNRINTEQQPIEGFQAPPGSEQLPVEQQPTEGGQGQEE